jgi:predicted metal-dependent phosphoesterase TrpH
LHTLSWVSLRFDLQAHSIHSDGTLPAAQVVERAASAGVELLALTDHDTVGGVSEALAAGKRLEMRVIPATEISAIDDDAGREVHILAYAIDHLQPQLSECLAEFLADRERRTMRMAGALRELGWQLDERELHARQAAGEPIGRPHLAAAVLRCPANAGRLRAESIDDVGSLIGAYLTEGRPAFHLRETPTVAQAVQASHRAGGLAVWAHPFWDIPDPAEVLQSVDRFQSLGIDGVEAFYITHTREQTRLLAEYCAARGLLTTGSADFHGPENRLFSRFLAFDTFGLEPNLGPLGCGPLS